MKNKFKVGDMVECISDENGTWRITPDKTYKVLEVFPHYLRIVNDEGYISEYKLALFKPSNSKPMTRDTKGRFTGKKNAVNVPTEAESISAFIKDEVDRQVKAMMAEIRNEVKTETQKEAGFFEPKEGEQYYFVDPFGDIDVSTSGYEPVLFDDRVLVGNCFRTEQDATDHLEYLKAIRRIKKYIYENGMSCSINRNERYYEVFYSFLEERWMTYPLLNISPSHILPCLPTMDNANKLIQDCASDLEIIKNYSMSHNF